MPGWPAPTSPTPLVQERPEVAGDPWRLLVVCVLCNKTRGEVAWPVALALFARWPTPEAMSAADPRDLEVLLRPLGLQVARSRRLVALSARYADAAPWSDPTELPGVGAYARDAWAIFVEGRTDVTPSDGHLNRYVSWRESCGTWGGSPPIVVASEEGPPDVPQDEPRVRSTPPRSPTAEGPGRRAGEARSSVAPVDAPGGRRGRGRPRVR